MINIWEAIGYAFVIYQACCGIAAHGWAVIHGIRCYKQTIDVGRLHEDAAVRDYLPGVRR